MNPLRTPVIALAGNPNTGKTTLFNALCGTRQRTGNYPGITVEKKTGSLNLGDLSAEVIDLPGLYSLKPVSPDEEVAADVIMGRIQGVPKPDLILFVLDASNLKRNLYLYSQVAELGLPVIGVLTMSDMLESLGIELDTETLQKELGIPLVTVTGGTKAHLENLKNTVSENLKKGQKSFRGNLPVFPEAMEAAASQLKQVLDKTVPLSLFEARELLYSKNSPLIHFYKDSPEASEALQLAQSKAAGSAWGGPSLISVTRYKWIDEILKKSEIRNPVKRKTFSDRLDSLFVNRFTGPVFFAGIMYLVFQAIYSWSGPLMDLIDAGFSSAGDFSAQYLDAFPVLQSLVSEGIIGGVGSVVIFVPQIFILFIFIAFLEDSGYLSRAAFLMDKLLSWTCLNGRAFIPMLSSFACSIPGIMAARVMPDPRARMTTILVAPLMSCSARLPVYILFIGAFIEPVYGAGWAAFTLFAMHWVGLVFALPVAWILNRGVLKTPTIPFILEMPPYRMPRMFDVFYRGFEASFKFLTRAGTVIFALSIVIWFLSYFPHAEPSSPLVNRDQTQEMAAEVSGDTSEADSEDLYSRSLQMENSYLGMMGKAVQPVFAPLGFDWRISIGIISAFPAREVIVSTLSILYHTGEEDEESLRNTLSQAKDENGNQLYTPLFAVTLMVFFALSSQCMSTLAVVWKELGSWKWAVILFTYMTLLAYAAALLVRITGKLLGFS